MPAVLLRQRHHLCCLQFLLIQWPTMLMFLVLEDEVEEAEEALEESLNDP